MAKVNTMKTWPEAVRHEAYALIDCAVPVSVSVTSLRLAASVMGLCLGDVEAAIEEHGRCDTNRYILIPLEPSK